ncbi:MAG TPA: hypothetical protein VFN30_11460 [Chitinophagaceae bacterium]|nr:hypothetical protein [Chitinophagaceae bacterium]
MICIFCNSKFGLSPVEHIVPESLGNIEYVVPKNIICKVCNTSFSEFEKKAINNTHLGFIRIKNGIKTKKNKPATFELGHIKAVGDSRYQKDLITFDGLKEGDTFNHKPDGSYQLTIPDFDKSEMATAKMLLKIGFESIYKSQKGLLTQYDFTPLKEYLTNKSNKDWPFLTSYHRPYKFKSIPTFNDKHHLNKIKCKLGFYKFSSEVLLFDFQYDYMNLTIDLLNRDYSWCQIYFENDTSTTLYPKHLKK